VEPYCEDDNLRYHRKCLVTVARHLGLLEEITDSDGTRLALCSKPSLSIDLYDAQQVTYVSAGDIAWDILAAVDEQKSLIQYAVKVLADHGLEDAALSDYVSAMQNFPIRANPDRRDL
jgi:hypothetical protein